MKTRINPSPQNGTDLDEVFITSDEPYVNRTVHAKPGIFTEGEFSEDQILALEARSNTALIQDHNDLLAREEAERKQAKISTENIQPPTAVEV